MCMRVAGIARPDPRKLHGTLRGRLDSPPRRSRQALLWIVKIVVSSGLLYLLFSRGNVHIADVWQQVRTASPIWIVVSLAIYFVMILIATWRWRILLGAQHLVLSFRTLLS